MTDYAALMWEEVADIADLLDSIDDADFDRPSLCADWRVRDVLGHMLYGHTSPGRTIAGDMVRFRGNVHRASFERSKEFGGSHSPDELRQLWREELAEKHTERGIAKLIKHHEGFLDHLIHNQDMRRPLGRARTIPEPRLRAALDLLPEVQTPIFGTKKRVGGLRFQATDTDWAHGEGAVVEGPGEALILAAAGRTAALDDLSGEGLGELRRRLSA